MATFLNKMRYLSKRITTNQMYLWKHQFFHTNGGLFDNPAISEKPAWLKKFKRKQAAFQKDDDLPVYLKKGLPDKILYNFTLGAIVVETIRSFQLIKSFDIPKNE